MQPVVPTMVIRQWLAMRAPLKGLRSPGATLSPTGDNSVAHVSVYVLPLNLTVTVRRNR